MEGKIIKRDGRIRFIGRWNKNLKNYSTLLLYIVQFIWKSYRKYCSRVNWWESSDDGDSDRQKNNYCGLIKNNYWCYMGKNWF